jgi:hypothetical protein
VILTLEQIASLGIAWLDYLNEVLRRQLRVQQRRGAQIMNGHRSMGMARW